MNDDARVTLATAEDADDILALINVVQPHVPWTRAHLSWQFFETPAGPSLVYLLRDQGSRLVALYAAVTQVARVAGREYPARMVQDVMTHPDYRGRGFLHRLGALCIEDMGRDNAIGYTFPNEQSEKSFRRLGWTELCAVPHREKSVQPKVRAGVRGIRQPDIRQIDGPFDPAVSEIWVASGFPVGVRRDAAFLNWRYRKPGATYHRFLIGEGAGILVLKLYQGDQGRVVHICECLLREVERTRVRVPVNDALGFAELFAHRHQATLLTAWLPTSHPYASTFDDHGLTLTEQSRYMFVRAPTECRPAVEDLNLWHVSQGDSDVY